MNYLRFSFSISWLILYIDRIQFVVFYWVFLVSLFFLHSWSWLARKALPRANTDVLPFVVREVEAV